VIFAHFSIEPGKSSETCWKARLRRLKLRLDARLTSPGETAGLELG